LSKVSIAPDHALILPHRASFRGWNFRERQEATTESARFAIVVDGVVRTHRNTRDGSILVGRYRSKSCRLGNAWKGFGNRFQVRIPAESTFVE